MNLSWPLDQKFATPNGIFGPNICSRSGPIVLCILDSTLCVCMCPSYLDQEQSCAYPPPVVERSCFWMQRSGRNPVCVRCFCSMPLSSMYSVCQCLGRQHPMAIKQQQINNTWLGPWCYIGTCLCIVEERRWTAYRLVYWSSVPCSAACFASTPQIGPP